MTNPLIGSSLMRACARLTAPLALSLILAQVSARDAVGAREAPKPAKPLPSAASQEAPARRAAIGAFAAATPETVRLSPGVSTGQESLQPTVDYPSLNAARDSIGAMVHRSVNPGNPAVRLRDGPVRFKYMYAPDSTDGWAFHVAVTDTSVCPVDRVERALEAAGWAPSYGYSADGPDGTVLGFVTRRFLCVVEGTWDGGDDSDPTYVPAAGCEVTVTCVPRREDDVPKW